MVLRMIHKGTCTGVCRSSWMRNIKYALMSKSNPLHLSIEERQKLNTIIKELSRKRIKKAEPKKGKSGKEIKAARAKRMGLRPSPTESATKYCGKKMHGNDGNMYISKKNKIGICRWVKVSKK